MPNELHPQLFGLTFDEACVHLEAQGYKRIGEGDWAYVYATPGSSRVVRITPYDPAYLMFLQTCWAFPHKHLPTHDTLIRLGGLGYAVAMPRYDAGELTERKAFMLALQAAVADEADQNTLDSVAHILRRGRAAGEFLVPYFGGLDWTEANIMFDGGIPKLVDGFMQLGPIILDGITRNLPLHISQTEVESFLTIPYLRRHPP